MQYRKIVDFFFYKSADEMLGIKVGQNTVVTTNLVEIVVDSDFWTEMYVRHVQQGLVSTGKMFGSRLLNTR